MTRLAALYVVQGLDHRQHCRRCLGLLVLPDGLPTRQGLRNRVLWRESELVISTTVSTFSWVSLLQKYTWRRWGWGGASRPSQSH